MQRFFFAKAGDREIGPFDSYQDALEAAALTLGDFFVICEPDEENALQAA